MRRVFSGVLAVSAGLGGCASVVRGTDEAVAFTSNPPGAAVALSNGLQCAATPCDLKIARKDEVTATFSKPGYAPEAVRVTTHVAGGGVAAGAGNIIAGGFIGVGVDAYNGANLDHSPNPVDVTLRPVPAVPPGPARKIEPVS